MNTLTPLATHPLTSQSSNESNPQLSGGQNLVQGSGLAVGHAHVSPVKAETAIDIDSSVGQVIGQKVHQMFASGGGASSLPAASRTQGVNPQSDALPTMMHVLVVEDEPEIRQLIALHLKREGLKVDTAGSAEEAVALIEKQSYGLLLLDWMLPGASGLDITRSIRRRADRDDLAILMVTARAEATDIVMGLEAGADDYLTKPFEPAVLLARVRALMRRHRRASPETIEKEGDVEVLRAGNLALYPAIYEVKCGEETLSLTPSEFKLLTALIQNRGRVMTRDSLIGCVQGEGVSVVGRTVDTHVFGLRKKLGACSEIIETVRGVGYRVRPFET